MQVIVDGLLTNYVRQGNGNTLVILHGWGDSSRGWKNVIKAFAKDYDVIVPDLPGFGGTQNPPVAWGLDEYTGFIAAFLKKIEVKRVYGVLAHSNGGAIAIRGLANGTMAADKLVLLASAGIRGTYKGRVKAIRYLTKTGKTLAAPLPKNIKQKLRHKVYTTIGSDMLVAEHLQETFKKVVTDDVQANAATLDLPALLIYGENDEQAPVWYGEKFHELIDGSTLEILPGAGHFVHIDRPTEVTKAIKDFLL